MAKEKPFLDGLACLFASSLAPEVMKFRFLVIHYHMVP